MSMIESYRDVLSENGHRDHIIGSAWIVAAVLGLVIVLLA
jgi:hypothetical protein